MDDIRPLVRVTTTTLVVLHALAQGDTYGFTICRRTGLPSGPVSRILHRLEEHGWIIGQWEHPVPEGRPRRRYYETTSGGRAAMEELLRQRRRSLPPEHWPDVA